MNNNSFWSEADLNILRSLYPVHGSPGVRESLPHKTVAAIRAQAARLGIRSPSTPKRADSRPWGMPTHTLAEQLDCVRLRNWRGPVMAGPLVGVIGRAYG